MGGLHTGASLNHYMFICVGKHDCCVVRQDSFQKREMVWEESFSSISQIHPLCKKETFESCGPFNTAVQGTYPNKIVKTGTHLTQMFVVVSSVRVNANITPKDVGVL